MAESLVGEVIDGKYLVERQLGKGGMGKVYLATHLGTDRPVALKVIVPQFMAQEEFVERFKREAKAAGRLRHPNVVDVTDFGFARVGKDQIAYLVMEYLDGCSLADILAEESTFPIAWVVDIIEQVCAAVAEAHKRGIVHRDLKPDNIWLEPNRRGGYTVKVLDFGLAKLSAEGRAGVESGQSTGGHSPGPQEGRKTSVDHRDPRVTSMQADLGLSTLAEAGLVTRHQAAVPDEEGKTQILTPGHVQAASPDEASGEAATIFITDNSEANAAKNGGDGATLILTDANAQGEALTSVHQGSGPDNADEGTRILPAATATLHQALSTQADDGLTRVGSVMGTPVYMSPEQCRGDEIDFRSDIYSIGVIAYQMLFGRPPFVGAPIDVINQHIGATPTPVRAFRKEIPRAMARTVMSALSKDPSKRPATAASLASSLRASLDVTGTLFRRGMALYSELFPKLFKVSLVAHLPVIVLAVIGVVTHSIEYHTQLHKVTVRVEIGAGAGDALLTFLAST
ncbi:MAG TPA: protein kinase, partial [Blastocatellia bacterium]